MSADETITVNGTAYGRPFTDAEGRPMVAVFEADGDRYVTYGVLPEVVEAWAKADAVAHGARAIAWDRDETDACQAGTPGCAIDHAAEPRPGSCEGW